jgi:hypothetical protein
MVRTSSLSENERLRSALDEITSLPADQLSQHPALVASLRSRCSHGIEIAADPEVRDVPLAKFTCFMHAFLLAQSTVVLAIARYLRNTYPGGEFVAFLIANYLAEVGVEDAREGDIILYSRGEEIHHAGRLKSGRVVSKWGTGHLWEHGIFELPARYGERTRFYRAVPSAVVEEAFVAYARQREGEGLINHLLGVREG